MKIELTDYDKEFAERNGLSYGEMLDYKEDMIKEEEIYAAW